MCIYQYLELFNAICKKLIFTLFVYDSCTRFRKKIKKFCKKVLTLYGYSLYNIDKLKREQKAQQGG